MLIQFSIYTCCMELVHMLILVATDTYCMELVHMLIHVPLTAKASLLLPPVPLSASSRQPTLLRSSQITYLLHLASCFG